MRIWWLDCVHSKGHEIRLTQRWVAICVLGSIWIYYLWSDAAAQALAWDRILSRLRNNDSVVMLVVVCNIERLYPTVVTWWQILLKALICNSSLSNYATICNNSTNWVFAWWDISICRWKLVIDWMTLIFGSIWMWNTIHDLVLVSYLLTDM